MTPLVPWLEGKGARVHSQYQEDGLIAATFERIGIRNYWCFEVGAGDGVSLSNTKVLRDAGWNAVLIDSSPVEFKRLQGNATATTEHLSSEHIDVDSLDRILEEAGAPVDMDFGVIDIDGEDYWVWDGLRKYQPRVMLVEFGLCGPDALPQPGEPGQAGRASIIELGVTKGYTALAVTHVNVLFCKHEVL